MINAEILGMVYSHNLTDQITTARAIATTKQATEHNRRRATYVTANTIYVMDRWARGP